MKKLFYVLILFLVACSCEDVELLYNSDSSATSKQKHIIMTKQVYTGSLLLMDHSDKYTAHCDVVTLCIKKLELLEAANEY